MTTSDVRISAVLSQVEDEEGKAIGYFRNTGPKPQQNYRVARRELLDIVQFIRHFHKYLL